MKTESWITLSLGAALSVFASIILLYISVATMIGPWIAPTLVLVASLLLKGGIFRQTNISKQLTAISGLASGSGIIAVGVGFSLPMFYFLAPHEFTTLIANPYNFIGQIGLTILLAGIFGIFVGSMFSKMLLDKEDLTFPISQITHQIAAAQSHSAEAKSLFQGGLSTIILCFFRDGFLFFKGIIPKNIPLFNSLLSGPVVFPIWPTLWAVGYITGLESTIPLLIGLIARYAVLFPINHHSCFLPFSLFGPLKEESFITAFCAGMILSDILLSLLSNPRALFDYCKKYITTLKSPKTPFFHTFIFHPIKNYFDKNIPLSMFIRSLNCIEPLLGLCSFFIFFSYLKFNILAQLIILIAMLIALYEINRLCGKIGLLQLGRFSAIILIPIILVFKINPLQMTALTIFFNIAAAVSSDLLFDYKTAQLSSLKKDHMHGLQWIGLFISCISVAATSYVLFTSFQLGSTEFFAHRGRSKAILIQSLHFDHIIVIVGFLFGWLLRKLKISPTMAFGGILMPSQITLGFLFGGILAKVTGNKKGTFLTFSAGVFATETLWLLISLGIHFIMKIK